MAESDPEDPIQRKIAQFYKGTFKIQKTQNARLMSAVKKLKNEMKSTTSKQNEVMDTRIPPLTQKHILERFRKEYTIDKSI